jgi:hypothetical protein
MADQPWLQRCQLLPGSADRYIQLAKEYLQRQRGQIPPSNNLLPIDKAASTAQRSRSELSTATSEQEKHPGSWIGRPV